MQCPKCNHPISDTSAHCMYCGSLTGDSTIPETCAVPDKGDQTILARQPGPFKLEDDLVNKNLQVSNGVCSDGYEIVIEQAEEVSSAEDIDHHIDALSLEKTVAMLAKMKNLLDSGRFDANVYEHMTLDAVKDYLATMADSAQLIFVSYEIQNSDLGPFLTQQMIDRLRMFVMDAIAQR